VPAKTTKPSIGVAGAQQGAPIAQGVIGPQTAAALATARTREFTIGDLRGATYEWPDWRALRLGETIEIVEPIPPRGGAL
jgi:hypothetical protein